MQAKRMAGYMDKVTMGTIVEHGFDKSEDAIPHGTLRLVIRKIFNCNYPVSSAHYAP